MGCNYKKIEFDTEGVYGSTQKSWIYIKSSRTTDSITVYDKNYEKLFSFTEWDEFDMGKALVIAFTDWNNEKMLDLTNEEIKGLKQTNK